MSMNPGQTLMSLRQIIIGNGFLRTVTGISWRDLTEAAGNKLDASSTPPVSAIESTGLGVVVASSATFVGELNMTVPWDYDSSQDHLKFNILCNSAGDTDTPSIDAVIYRKRVGAAISSDLDPTISAVVNTNTALAAVVTVDASGLSLQAGDVLQITFNTGGTRGTTNALNVYGLDVEYRSTLVYADIDSPR
ncbi:hypothetical protein LCGC14_2582110 [marine sediment metagenome]|uniref:Uncharacterized protein n=1 Tax=marine sediment metagenome TaxID=412755 RepID=A0A0F9B230_9ZZZZ